MQQGCHPACVRKSPDAVGWPRLLSPGWTWLDGPPTVDQPGADGFAGLGFVARSGLRPACSSGLLASTSTTSLTKSKSSVRATADFTSSMSITADPLATASAADASIRSRASISADLAASTQLFSAIRPTSSSSCMMRFTFLAGRIAPATACRLGAIRGGRERPAPRRQDPARRPLGDAGARALRVPARVDRTRPLARTASRTTMGLWRSCKSSAATYKVARCGRSGVEAAEGSVARWTRSASRCEGRRRSTVTTTTIQFSWRARARPRG
mmetsp:Transcript_49812/g.114107  ORF Transcript_49812/g.114107 Transcript_49812/m.114107 type:complete len:270 (+) Transcript_49812:218-1027(+)